jgi:hypothetical protein
MKFGESSNNIYVVAINKASWGEWENWNITNMSVIGLRVAEVTGYSENIITDQAWRTCDIWRVDVGSK